jgi:hypothetical protein
MSVPAEHTSEPTTQGERRNVPSQIPDPIDWRLGAWLPSDINTQHSIQQSQGSTVRMIPVPSVGYFYYHLAKGGASVHTALAAVVGKDRSKKESLILGPGGTASCLAATTRSDSVSNLKMEVLVTLSLGTFNSQHFSPGQQSSY